MCSSVGALDMWAHCAQLEEVPPGKKESAGFAFHAGVWRPCLFPPHGVSSNTRNAYQAQSRMSLKTQPCKGGGPPHPLSLPPKARPSCCCRANAESGLRHRLS